MNINHLTISGNLVRDPELKTVGADKVVCKFTIANNNKFKVNGEVREETSFIDCEAWGKTAEIAGQYLNKGSSTIVEGKLSQENWQDKEGQKRSKLKLKVDTLHLMPRGEKTASDESPAHAHHPAIRPASRSVASAVSDEEVPF
jgi:single-strand DNA-binding protein